jgi:hypothetical protein
MAGNKRLRIFRDKVWTDQKYTQKVKWKRSTKFIFLKFSCKEWNIFYNFKVKCRRPLILFVDASIVCPPIAGVEIDSSCVVNRIHATHFWETALSTLANFIECGNGSGIRMGASTLVKVCTDGEVVRNHKEG